MRGILLLALATLCAALYPGVEYLTKGYDALRGDPGSAWAVVGDHGWKSHDLLAGDIDTVSTIVIDGDDISVPLGVSVALLPPSRCDGTPETTLVRTREEFMVCCPPNATFSRVSILYGHHLVC